MQSLSTEYFFLIIKHCIKKKKGLMINHNHQKV